MTRTARTIGATATLALALAGSALTQPAEPFVEFMGSHFYITRSPIDTFGGVAFDPVNDLVYSEGIFDVCGTEVDANFASDAGLAWDPITEEVWKINTTTRDVYRDVGGAPELIFSIPLTFDVPGVGADTLESPQGLALDNEHVYVVDAGANIGEREGNGWFKFTRDGTPVSSSKATDFVASIDAPVDDAIADGITWCPPSSPVAPGLFLVAFEHTGIMVIDEDGFFVDDITWEDSGLTYGQAVPFAFAGLTIDPTTGDLYLVENDGSSHPAHVWVRIPDDEPVLFGSFGFVHYPDTRCERRLIATDAGSGAVFGLAYRPLDGLLWGTDFSTGVIVKIDPLSGRTEQEVAGQGINYWGIAYDEERDDFYLYSAQDQVYVIEDPENPTVVPLPQPVGGDFAGDDIAFNPDDGNIYVTTGFGGATSLVRIDRDTGAGTPVGSSIFTGGLTYDRVAGQLIGIVAGVADNSLYYIDPQTGAEALLAVSAATFSGWEGLALIRTPDSTVPVGDVVGDPHAPTHPDGMRLRMAPNPFRSATRVSFTLALTDRVRIAAYDVGGRLVRTLAEGVLRGGPHEVVWDARTDGGTAVAPGMYFIRMHGDRGAARTEKAFVLR